jgi:hypothetical protein
LQEKIMIAILRSKFRSRDAAFAAARKLSDLDPAHECEAWPYRGYWVLVMRYRDDDGHMLFKFVGSEDRFSAAEPKPHAAQTALSQAGDRGNESARRHRRVHGEAMRQ